MEVLISIRRCSYCNVFNVFSCSGALTYFPDSNRYTMRERVMKQVPEVGNDLTHAGFIATQPID